MSVDPLVAALRPLVEQVCRELLAALRAEQPPEYLTTAEAGDLARVSPQAIRRWIADGRLPGHRAGREVRVRRGDLERLLAGAPEQP